MADINRTSADVRGLATGGNEPLAAMDVVDLTLIAERGRREYFAIGQTIEKSEGASDAIFFVENGVASVIKEEESGRRTEICLIGPEGFYGAAIVLAGSSYPYQLISQAHRLSVIRLPAADARTLLAQSASASAILLAAIHVQMQQIAENLVSAVWQAVGPRLARWLLMYRERMRSDRIEVTHAFMAVMIGAQRTKVTAALHELEASRAIVSSRGLVQIKDVGLLQSIAEGRYGAGDTMLVASI